MYTYLQGTVAKQTLQEDDKRGATQIYGPWTGFDADRAIGMQNQIDFSINVSGYCCGVGPELHPVGAQGTATPWYGDGMELIAGTANASQSFAYFKLFDNANDVRTIYNAQGVAINTYNVRLYINSGMRLKWCQYNYQQSTFSLNFQTDDGSTFGNSGLRDVNYSAPSHATFRGNLPQKQWLCFDYDLRSLQGKRINKWWIVYDNSNTGITGQFRAYFDGIRFIWPGNPKGA